MYLPIGFLDFTTIQAALHHLVGKLSYTLAVRLLHIRVTLALIIICAGHTDAFTVFILTPEALPYPVYEPHHMSLLSLRSFFAMILSGTNHIKWWVSDKTPKTVFKKVEKICNRCKKVSCRNPPSLLGWYGRFHQYRQSLYEVLRKRPHRSLYSSSS